MSPKEKQKKMGSVYCARNLDEEIPFMNVPRFAAKIDGLVKIKVGSTQHNPLPFDGLEVRKEPRSGLSNGSTQVGKWNHFFHIECEETWHMWCIENYMNGCTIKCPDYPLGASRCSEDESWMGRCDVRVEREIAYTQPSVIRALFMDIVKSPGMVGLPDDARLVFVDSDGSKTDDVNKKRKRSEDGESIAETEVPSDDECDDIPIVLENVPHLMKRFCIKREWTNNHSLALKHAHEDRGIRGKDGKIVYGEENELKGVDFDLASRASCELYLRVRKKYYSNRDTYGCGYLNAALTIMIAIHDAHARGIRNKKQKTSTAIELEVLATPQSNAPKTGDKLVCAIATGGEVNAALQSLHTSTICPLNIPKTCRELMRAVKEDASGTFDNLFESIGSGVKPNATIADVHDARVSYITTACKYIILKHIGKSTSLDSLVWNATWYGFPDLLENVHKHFPDFDLMQVLPHMDKYDAQSYQWIKEKFPDCLPPVELVGGAYWPIRS